MYDYPMIDWAKDLFPIARSLTGDGVRETFAYLGKINPEIRLHSFPTGTQVFDWTIPREWKVRDAYIEHVETGRRFAEFKRNNLHLLGYSTPIDAVMEKSELLSHIYTQADQPDLIPYVTSYYKERWGFCMAQTEKDALPEGEYRAFVDSDLFEGELLTGDALIQGKTDRELMFSSYICHPSMANNELSGPVLITALLQYVKTLIRSRTIPIVSSLSPKQSGQSRTCRATLMRCRPVLNVGSICPVSVMNGPLVMCKAATATQ